MNNKHKLIDTDKYYLHIKYI